MRVLLSLDLSTTCTGWAKLDLDTKELLEYGSMYPEIKNPVKKGVPTYEYPEWQVLKLRALSDQVLKLIDEDVEQIVIEEINRGKNRLGQKVLDGFHFVLLERMASERVKTVFLIDSDGKIGWRSQNGLKLQLSTFDKETNKKNKKLNKKLAKGLKKLPVVTQKTLAVRYVNKRYELTLTEEDDSDAADAIGLGTFVVDRLSK